MSIDAVNKDALYLSIETENTVVPDFMRLMVWKNSRCNFG